MTVSPNYYNGTTLHPPIFVLVLERTPERTLNIKRQLDALNLNYQLVYGIDKHNLSNKKYRLKLAQQYGMDESIMEHKYANGGVQSGLAVSLTHLKVYDLMIRNKIPVACILEDDINILPTFPKVLTAALKSSWDILMLSNHSEGGVRLIRILARLFSSNFKISKFLKQLVEYHKDYPGLPTTYRTKIVMQCMLDIMKRCFYYYSSRGKETKRAWKLPALGYERYLFAEYYSCKMGALPARNKSYRHKIYNHHMVEPFELPSSGMAYMLTLSAATKWRKEALSSNVQQNDSIPWQLFSRGEAKVYILIPPCVIAIHKYLRYSVRRPKEWSCTPEKF